MKKILLLLVSFISLGVAAAEVVPITEEFPIYSGYITYPGSAQSIFSELVSDLDDDDPSITYSVDRENKSVTMTVREVEEGIVTIVKMKFTAATNRINYSIKVKLMMDGEDITSLLVGGEESYFIDGYVSALLEALADEL